MENKPNIAAQIKEPVSNLIMKQLEDVRCLAADTADRASDKLEPISNSSIDIPQPSVKETSSDFPPLFSEMRGMLNSIKLSLQRINNDLSRAEI